MTRRNFLSVFFGVGLAWLWSVSSGGCAHQRAPEFEGRPPVLQGLTTADRAQFAVVVPKSAKVTYKIAPAREAQGKDLKDLAAQRFSQTHSDWVVDKFTAKHLQPGKTYWLHILNGRGKVIDQREFQALDLNAETIRFAAISCMDDGMTAEQAHMWPKVLAQAPQMILMIGDNVYADKYLSHPKPAEPEDLWRRYVETRQKLDIFHREKLVPTLAIWDDHDYGDDDGDSSYPHKGVAAQVFRAFFAQDEFEGIIERGPGVGYLFNGFGQAFAFLDNRSFRSPKGARPEDETQWGALQERWLLSKLQKAHRPVWIVNGDQIFGAYHDFESYEKDRPTSFKARMTSVFQQPSPVAFLTGDRHLAEVMRIAPKEFGYATYEFTSSGLHARVFPGAWDKKKNPRQVFGVSGVHNFMMLESQPRPTSWDIRAQVFTADSDKPVFDKKLNIKR